MSEPRTFTDDHGVEFVEAKPDDIDDPCSGCAFVKSYDGCGNAHTCMEYIGERLKVWVWKRKESK